MEKVINISAKLNCTPMRAFEMFTMNELLESWLTKLADVEPKIGGKYELFWDVKDKQSDSTIGCKITALEPDKLVAFEWKGPKKYNELMNSRDPLTHVVVFFESCKGEEGLPITDVHLVHSGWGSGPEWEEARAWFDKAWRDAFKNLRKMAVQ